MIIYFIIICFIFIYYIFPFFVKKIYLLKLKKEKKYNTVFLTFDDGPHPGITCKILEILKKRKIKANFFVLGSNAKKYPEILEKIFKEGHNIGIHSNFHLHPWFTDPISYLFDLINAVKNLNNCITKDRDNKVLFRPPYGKFNAITLFYIFLTKKKVVLWDIDTKDYMINSVNQVFESVIKKIDNNSIILFHDNRLEKNLTDLSITINVLDKVINYGLKHNIIFKTFF